MYSFWTKHLSDEQIKSLAKSIAQALCDEAIKGNTAPLNRLLKYSAQQQKIGELKK